MDQQMRHERRKRNMTWFTPPTHTQPIAIQKQKKDTFLSCSISTSLSYRRCSIKNTVKLSYICTSNLGPTVKIKRQKGSVQQTMMDSEKCNCIEKNSVHWMVLVKRKEWFYKAEVKDANDQSKINVGCTEGPFRKRWYNHKSSFGIKSRRNCTRLASNVWKLK